MVMVPLHHALAGHEHEDGDAHGNDRALADVQKRQRGLVAHRRLFPGLQRLVVTARLEALVVEIFHGLVIEQAVDGARVGLGVHLVHVAPEDHAPLGDPERESDVHHQRHQRHDAEPGVVLDQQDRRHEADLEDGGQDVEQHEVEQEADASGAALDVARHAAGLAFEMETQGQVVQVLEDLERHAPDRALRDLGEHGVAQFAEGRVGQPQRAVGDEQENRQDQRGAGRAERVDDFLQHQRDGNGGHLGERQERERQHHPAAEFPQIGQERFDRIPVALARRGLSVVSRSHRDGGQSGTK
jgi:hypothetical protein